MPMFLSIGLLVAVVVASVVLAFMIGRGAAIACAVAGMLLVGMTYAEAQFSDRWAESNVDAQEFAQRFASVPMEIGDWVGEDQPVEEAIRKKTGAVGYVSRMYTNQVTGQQVSLWLIVGHSRDICRHTPDICYQSSGFHMQGQENSQHVINVEGAEPATFFTNSFIREDRQTRSLMRVFWTWYKPDDTGVLEWQAPEYQRFEFGNARALYKMYFSSQMTSPTQTADESPCVEFAEEFLPIVEAALTEDVPAAETSSAA